MNIQLAEWWNRPNGTARNIGFGFCVLSIVTGLLYAAAPTRSNDAANDANPRLAVATADLSVEPAMNTLQAVIDASPTAPIAFGPKPGAPSKNTASVKPVSAPTRIASHAKARQTAAGSAPSSDVARFDHCLPQCETRDPLIAGYSDSGPYPLAPSSPVRDDSGTEPASSPLQQAGKLLSRVADAPGAVIRGGREALTTIVRADW